MNIQNNCTAALCLAGLALASQANARGTHVAAGRLGELAGRGRRRRAGLVLLEQLE